MNITGDVRDYILTKLTTLYGPLTIDAFSPEVESLKIQGDPSSAVEKQFIDGSVTGTQMLSFYARSKNPDTAKAALESIRKELDQVELTLTDVLFIRVQPMTLVAFVEKDTAGASTYYFTVAVEYDGNNPQGV